MRGTLDAAPAHDAWRLPAVPASIAELRDAIRTFARGHGVEGEPLDALAIAVSEAVTNAVLHAFVGREPGSIEMVAQAGPDELLVRVRDDGRGMQPRPDSPGLGMGLPTIGQLTTSVEVRENDDGAGTEVCMTFAAPGVRGPLQDFADAPGEHLELLGRITRLLDAGGWPNAGVREVVDLLVPQLADVCAIDLLDEEGVPRRIAAVVADPGGAELGAWLRRRAPSPNVEGTPTHAALRLAGPQLGEMTAEAVDAVAVDAADRDRIAGLGTRWWVVLPLREGERMLGVLHFGLRSGRGRPDAARLAFLEEVAHRAAHALANTRLIDELARTRRRLEGILEVLAEAVTVQDADGRTIYANAAAVRLLEADRAEEVVGRAPGELAAQFILTREDGTPLTPEDFPGRRVVAGEAAEPLLTRSVSRRTGVERWRLTKATLLDDGPLAVNVIEDVTDAVHAERRLRYLVRAGEVLGAGLDEPELLQGLAGLVVPDLADWCVVDVLEPGRVLRRAAVAHADPAKLATVRDMTERYPPEEAVSARMWAIVDGGPAQLHPELTDEMLAGQARDAEELRLLREVGMRSVLLLPMRVEDRTLGVLTLITAESARTFTSDDLAFAEDIARRAAMAVDRTRRM